ncbi:hypothetical protein C1701_16455 [Actinoalloteichus sp. AHMU CJ021]|nr:hypothetical protein C1701_16455 [Actinoalloteichus sp. AHMU CJ021]
MVAQPVAGIPFASPGHPRRLDGPPKVDGGAVGAAAREWRQARGDLVSAGARVAAWRMGGPADGGTGTSSLGGDVSGGPA